VVKLTSFIAGRFCSFSFSEGRFMGDLGRQRDAVAPSIDAGEKLKVFISYSRQDLAIADKLATALEMSGFEIFIDRRDLPYGEEWKAELADFIRSSDSVIWLVSTASVGSKWCRWELGEVSRLSKRLLPVLIDEDARGNLPEALGRIHLLPGQGVFSFDVHLESLVAALNTDHVWMKQHTRLADRAHEWQSRERASELLLRGAALSTAESWKDKKPRSAPAPSAETLELILASRRAATRRQRWATAAALAVAALSGGLAVVAYLQRTVAIEQRERAAKTRNEALLNQSQFLTGLAEERRIAQDEGTAALLGLEALQDSESEDENRKTRLLWPPAEYEVNRSIERLHERKVLAGHRYRVTSIAFSPDGMRIVSGSDDETARMWDAKTGAEFAWLARPREHLTKVAFSLDGTQVITGGLTVRLWDARTGAELAQLKSQNGVSSVALNPDGLRVAVSYEFGTNLEKVPRIWDVKSGTELVQLKGHGNAITCIAFSPDGARVITGSRDWSARIWDANTGAQLELLQGHENPLLSVAFSSDGSRVVTSSSDRTARTWDAGTGKELARLNGHAGAVNSAAFSPDGLRVVTGSQDGTARIWDAGSGAELAQLVGHDGPLSSVAFSPDGSSIGTGSRDKTVRIWDTKSRLEVSQLRGHEAAINAVGPNKVSTLLPVRRGLVANNEAQLLTE
jgi:WD40 repeat protein